LGESFDTGNVSPAVDYIRLRTSLRPIVAIILGSGLGDLADQRDRVTAIPYAEIPGVQSSSAAGHRGQLILGMLEHRPVVAMVGRLHRYEGWSNDEVTFPVEIVAALGARSLIVSNAAGGVSPQLRVGDLVTIRDHIDWIGGFSRRYQKVFAPAPLRCAALYDDRFAAIARRVGVEHQFNVWPGTYLATLGPTYETRSEYRMMRRIGVDVVGMSTVPEVMAAAALGMRIAGLSMVSNVASPDVARVADHGEVLAAGQQAAAKLEAIVRAVVRSV